MGATTLDDLGAAKYISMTTYRKDGTAVPTPVWLARNGDVLVVITDPNSGKSKRLRNNASVLVTACDMRGRVKAGAVGVPGSVQFQDGAQTKRTLDLIAKRYGLMGRIMTRLNERKARKAGGGEVRHVGLSITLEA